MLETNFRRKNVISWLEHLRDDPLHKKSMEFELLGRDVGIPKQSTIVIYEFDEYKLFGTFKDKYDKETGLPICSVTRKDLYKFLLFVA